MCALKSFADNESSDAMGIFEAVIYRYVLCESLHDHDYI